MSNSAGAQAAGGHYRSFVLFLLCAVTVMNFVDRQLIGILSPAIQSELKLSDAEMGLLKGIVFALLYTALGVPIAWLADRWNRVSIVSLSLATWSGFTVLSGYASNFVQLALSRVGVGIGEAGGSAPIHSLISDYFPEEKRAKAMAILAMGIPLGAGLSFLLGGWLLQTYGWRVAFVAMGVPGIVLAVIVKLVVREPIRGNQEVRSEVQKTQSVDSQDISSFGAFRHLFSIPTWRAVAFGAAAATFSSAATGTWIIDLFVRAHPNIQLELVLLALGLSIGVGFTVGTFLGGWIVDRYSVRDKRVFGSIPAIALAINVPCSLFWIWWNEPYLALIVQFIGASTVGVYYGPSFALVQSLAPVAIRARSTAFFFVIANLIGLGLGPTLVGAVSEIFLPHYGAITSLRIGLTLVTLSSIYGAWVFWRMQRQIEIDWNEAKPH